MFKILIFFIINIFFIIMMAFLLLTLNNLNFYIDNELLIIDYIKVNSLNQFIFNFCCFFNLNTAYFILFFIATDLEKLVHKLGTPEDSEPLRDR